MKKFAILVIGILIGCFATSTVAQETARHVLGVLISFHEREEFDISLGIGPGDRPLRARRVQQQREVVAAPAHYGSVFAVTGGEGVAVLWFRDEQGLIRNAVVDDPIGRLYVVRPTSVNNLRIEGIR